MTLKNEEMMQRAIGIIEGISWVSTDEKLADALLCVVEMLDSVIESENKENDHTYLALKAALDLINRQKAEIERLEKHNTEYARKHYQDGRAEAIKEFADRLCEGRVSNDPVVIAVNAELKMTEEKE